MKPLLLLNLKEGEFFRLNGHAGFTDKEGIGINSREGVVIRHASHETAIPNAVRVAYHSGVHAYLGYEEGSRSVYRR